jgi:hypothetical protein
MIGRVGKGAKRRAPRDVRPAGGGGDATTALGRDRSRHAVSRLLLGHEQAQDRLGLGAVIRGTGVASPRPGVKQEWRAPSYPAIA